MSSGTAAYATSATVYGRNPTDSYYQPSTGSGPSPIGPDLTLTGNLTVDGTSTLTGAVTAGNTLAVTGAVTAGSTLAVTGNATVGGNMIVTGAVVAAGQFTATTGTPVSQQGGSQFGGLLWDFTPSGIAYNAPMGVPGLYIVELSCKGGTSFDVPFIPLDQMTFQVFWDGTKAYGGSDGQLTLTYTAGNASDPQEWVVNIGGTYHASPPLSKPSGTSFWWSTVNPGGSTFVNVYRFYVSGVRRVC